MNIERISTAFQRAGWKIIPAPTNVTPAGTLYGQGPGGNGVLTIRGDGSGATIQLPMHRGMTERQAKQTIVFGRLLIATLPEPTNKSFANAYDRMIVRYAEQSQQRHGAELQSNPYCVKIEWQPEHGKLIVKIEEIAT
jgi:hypothetical protein